MAAACTCVYPVTQYGIARGVDSKTCDACEVHKGDAYRSLVDENKRRRPPHWIIRAWRVLRGKA